MLLCIDDILAFVSILQLSRNAQEFDKNAFDTTLKKLKKSGFFISYLLLFFDALSRYYERP